MSPEEFTPSDVVAANIRVYMRWRGLTQKGLAQRMTVIGMGLGTQDGGRTMWYQRTIGQILTGHRRIDVNELFGLAVALEVTVGALLSPLIDEIADFDAEYRVGDLESLGFSDFEILVEDLAERESRPRLVLDGWSGEDSPQKLPQWSKKPSPVEKAASDAVRDLKSAYEAAHPGIKIETVSASDILQWAEDQRAEPDP